tara:strand:+ start:118 stop:474 length:357 start_codon:yes stop_codon:yes gene_type:complete
MSRNTSNLPAVNSDFVVMNLAASATAVDVVDLIRSQLDDIGANLTPVKGYSSGWSGLLFCSNTVAVQILTSNGSPAQHVATGINIPIGHSLYLPYTGNTESTLQYISNGAACSVAVFF